VCTVSLVGFRFYKMEVAVVFGDARGFGAGLLLIPLLYPEILITSLRCQVSVMSIK
jgi:hypothetical protein